MYGQVRDCTDGYDGIDAIYMVSEVGLKWCKKWDRTDVLENQTGKHSRSVISVSAIN